jgi:hypothetical protein
VGVGVDVGNAEDAERDDRGERALWRRGRRHRLSSEAVQLYGRQSTLSSSHTPSTNLLVEIENCSPRSCSILNASHGKSAPAISPSLGLKIVSPDIILDGTRRRYWVHQDRRRESLGP